jgi:hypothetical protein
MITRKMEFRGRQSNNTSPKVELNGIPIPQGVRTRERSLSRSLSIAEMEPREHLVSPGSLKILSYTMEDVNDIIDGRTKKLRKERSATFDTTIKSSRKWYPDDLERIRNQTLLQIRPFLEIINQALAKCKETEVSVLTELKSYALEFLFSSAEEIQQGCKTIIRKLQLLEKELDPSLKKSSMAKDLIIKLLFILSSYSRVQEYITNVSQYMVFLNFLFFFFFFQSYNL